MRWPGNRGGLRTYLLIVGLIVGQSTPVWIAAGAPLLLAGIALHLWAKGCLHQEREVTTAGPYRLVRHPFYLANALLDLGLAVMSGWWPLQLALPVWWLAVYVPTIRGEEATLTTYFGPAYAAYRARVPALVPYRAPLPRGAGSFSWHNPNLARTEFPRAFRSLCYPLLFYFSYRLHQDRLDAVLAPGVGDVLAVAGFVAL